MVDPALHPLRLLQFGLETVNGTAVPATSKIEGAAVWLSRHVVG